MIDRPAMTPEYLKLLRDALAFQLWDEPALRPIESTGAIGWKAELGKVADRVFNRLFNLRVAMNRPPGSNGTDWPLLAHTMIGTKRLDNIRELCAIMDAENIPGAFVECGVWRGGASIYARKCLRPDRLVVCCDSFNGLPHDPAEPDWSRHDFLRVSEEEVRRNFDKFDALYNVQFVKGLFKDTLPQVPGPIAILRADGDMFSSTLAILSNLYPRVSSKGFVIIDDYHLAPCRNAVHEFLRQRQICPGLLDIDGRAHQRIRAKVSAEIKVECRSFCKE